MSEPLTPSGRLLLTELQELIRNNDTDGEMGTREREERYARKDAYRLALQLASRYVPNAEEEAVTGFNFAGDEPDPEDSPTWRPVA